MESVKELELLIKKGIKSDEDKWDALVLLDKIKLELNGKSEGKDEEGDRQNEGE